MVSVVTNLTALFLLPPSLYQIKSGKLIQTARKVTKQNKKKSYNLHYKVDCF